MTPWFTPAELSTAIPRMQPLKAHGLNELVPRKEKFAGLPDPSNFSILSPAKRYFHRCDVDAPAGRVDRDRRRVPTSVPPSLKVPASLCVIAACAGAGPATRTGSKRTTNERIVVTKRHLAEGIAQARAPKLAPVRPVTKSVVVADEVLTSLSSCRPPFSVPVCFDGPLAGSRRFLDVRRETNYLSLPPFGTPPPLQWTRAFP